ncbi:MAG TPA: DNA-binding protein, partial [Desulfosporosinus sp.]|nr:DNA-binding protein [Desulfosporosinus sp.]
QLFVTDTYRADIKGIVEQYFRLTNTRVKPLLPGAVLPDFKERGGKDYRLDAKLDIYQFTQIMIRCVLNHNRTLMKHYQRGEMMIEDDVPAIPWELWNWGIANRSGELRYFPEDIVKLNLMPSGKASVTEKGIVFQGMRFTTERAIKEMWFEQARLKGSWVEDISYDPRNINYIYLREPGGRSYQICTLLGSEEAYSNKSYDEVVYKREYERFTSQKLNQAQLQQRVDLNMDIDSIIKIAEGMAPEKDKLSSNTARVKNIKTKRKIEKAGERKKEAFVLAPEKNRLNNNNPAPVVPLSDETTENIGISKAELFRRKQQEKIYGRKKSE